MNVEFANPSAMAPPVGAYSHVARIPLPGADMLVISGQLAQDLDGDDLTPRPNNAWSSFVSLSSRSEERWATS